ncbi:hypothetical protein Tco_0722889 [Tanacetum coccineum]
MYFLRKAQVPLVRTFTSPKFILMACQIDLIADGSNFIVICQRLSTTMGGDATTVLGDYPGPLRLSPKDKLNSGIESRLADSDSPNKFNEASRVRYGLVKKSQENSSKEGKAPDARERFKAEPQKPKVLANFHLQGPILQFRKIFITRKGEKEDKGQMCKLPKDQQF